MLAGKLEDIPLTAVMQALFGSGLTGVLMVNSEESAKKIIFKDGMLISVTSMDYEDSIAELAVSSDKIDREKLDKVRETAVSSGWELEKALVSEGYISEEDIDELAQRYMERCLFELVIRPEGAFQFRQKDIGEVEYREIGPGVRNLLLQGNRDISVLKNMLEKIEKLDKRPGFRGNMDERALADNFELDDLFLLGMAGQRLNLRKMLNACGEYAFDFLSALTEWADRGVLEFRDESEADRGDSCPEGFMLVPRILMKAALKGVRSERTLPVFLRAVSAEDSALEEEEWEADQAAGHAAEGSDEFIGPDFDDFFKDMSDAEVSELDELSVKDEPAHQGVEPEGENAEQTADEGRDEEPEEEVKDEVIGGTEDPFPWVRRKQSASKQKEGMPAEPPTDQKEEEPAARKQEEKAPAGGPEKQDEEFEDYSDEEFSLDDEEDEKMKPAPPPRRSRERRAAPRKRFSDDDKEFSYEDDFLEEKVARELRYKKYCSNIKMAYNRIKRRRLNYFEILDIPIKAPMKKVRQKYLMLKKRYDPRGVLKPNDRSEHEQASFVLKKIEEAYQALIDPDTRREYMRNIKSKTQETSKKKEQALQLFHQGMKLHHDKKFKQAREKFKEAIALDPNNPVFYNMLASMGDEEKETQAYYYYRTGLEAKRRGNLDEAVLRIKKAIWYNPQVIYYLELAEILSSDREKIPEAIRFYQEVLKRDPGSVKTHLALGNLYLRTGSKQEAADHFNDVLKWTEGNHGEAESALNALKKEGVLPRKKKDQKDDQPRPTFGK